jgi:hypothetical protein
MALHCQHLATVAMLRSLLMAHVRLPVLIMLHHVVLVLHMVMVLMLVLHHVLVLLLLKLLLCQLLQTVHTPLSCIASSSHARSEHQLHKAHWS